MKVDKTNARHWVYLVIFTINVLVGVIFRWLKGRNTADLVLYGHKLNGNLRALYGYLGKRGDHRFSVSYLVVDPAYARHLRNDGVRVLSGLGVRDVIWACRAACVVTDHGPHSLYFLQKLTGAKFVDVWHGIPFKGFDQADFHWLHKYNATFVSSPSMKRMYENRYGFGSHQVKVTGYARTDALVNSEYEKQEILGVLGLPEGYRKIILFAPTWHHGKQAHSNIPFEMTPVGFFTRLHDLAQRHNWLIIFRAHLNSDDNKTQSFPNIRFIPLSEYPDTEALLFVSDVLVSDWSSIVFDFLVLRRPTVFIDITAPFAKGFSYGPEYRFGPVVSDFAQLTDTLVRSCERSDDLLTDYSDHMWRVRREVYGRYADGRATERYVCEIDRLLAEG